MKAEVQQFIEAVDEVLNGRTLVVDLAWPGAGEPATARVRAAVAAPEFDAKILESDLQQQEGDLFHALVSAGTLEPVVRKFPRTDALWLRPLAAEAAFAYLCSMLTAETRNGFWSPYGKQKGAAEARSLVEGFLGPAPMLGFYQLGTDFIFADSKSSGIHYWDRLDSDSCSVVVWEEKLTFIFTNGGD